MPPLTGITDENIVPKDLQEVHNLILDKNGGHKLKKIIKSSLHEKRIKSVIFCGAGDLPNNISAVFAYIGDEVYVSRQEVKGHLIQQGKNVIILIVRPSRDRSFSVERLIAHDCNGSINSNPTEFLTPECQMAFLPYLPKTLLLNLIDREIISESIKNRVLEMADLMTKWDYSRAFLLTRPRAKLLKCMLNQINTPSNSIEKIYFLILNYVSGLHLYSRTLRNSEKYSSEGCLKAAYLSMLNVYSQVVKSFNRRGANSRESKNSGGYTLLRTFCGSGNSQPQNSGDFYEKLEAEEMKSQILLA